jgi:hypothetical protein
MPDPLQVRATGEVERLHGLADDERHLLGVCVDRYIADMRAACEQDQGDPDGAEGTVGREMQERLNALKERLR